MLQPVAPDGREVTVLFSKTRRKLTRNYEKKTVPLLFSRNFRGACDCLFCFGCRPTLHEWLFCKCVHAAIEINRPMTPKSLSHHMPKHVSTRTVEAVEHGAMSKRRQKCLNTCPNTCLSTCLNTGLHRCLRACLDTLSKHMSAHVSLRVSLAGVCMQSRPAFRYHGPLIHPTPACHKRSCCRCRSAPRWSLQHRCDRPEPGRCRVR